MQNIENIIFDMGNVLLSYDPYVSLDKYCSGEEEKKIILKELFMGQEWVEKDLGIMTDDEAFERISSRVPKENHTALRNCLDYWDICMIPIRGSLEFVETVKNEGYNLYVLSNASTRFYKYFPKYYPLDTFKGVVVSADIHMIKPDMRIYDYILKKYDMAAQSSVFIDDSPDNIYAACRTGINGIIFNHNWEEIYEKIHNGI